MIRILTFKFRRILVFLSDFALKLLVFIERLLGEKNRSAQDKVFAQLQGSVHIFEYPERQTIEIHVLSRSPSSAAEIANRLGEMYQSATGQKL
jgi:hypothetical protein